MKSELPVRIKMVGCILCAHSPARDIVLVGNEWDKSDLHYASSSEILNRASTEIRIKAILLSLEQHKTILVGTEIQP